MRKILLILICVPIIAFAQSTSVPDDNFENYLEANGMGDGIALNNNVLTANINTVTILTIDWLNISDLTGIEDFIALTELRCHDNQITSLDLSNNPAVTFLDCGRNQLTSLDVSNNFALSTLWAGENQLTSLDVSQNSLLYYLNCSVNQLSSLDVCCNSMLTTLYCNQNNITNLDFSANHDLVFLDCHTNQSLTSLDLRNGNNINMTHLYCDSISTLSCVNVDNGSWSTNNWSTFTFNFQFPTGQTFSSNCPGSSYGCSFPDGVTSLPGFSWNTGFIYLGSFNGSTYFISDHTYDWSTANQRCIDHGGHLVTISDSIENYMIDSWAQQQAFWTGLYQDNNSPHYDETPDSARTAPWGGWQWVTGEPIIYTNWTDYSSGMYDPQPDNNGGEAYMQMINSNAEWNDLSNNNQLKYVIEFETDPLSCSLGCTDPLACNYDPNATIDDGSCYYSPTFSNIITNNPSTCVANDGWIDVSIVGGTPGYSYNWSNSEITEDINNLSAGFYTLTVTDSNNCSNDTTIILTDSLVMLLSVSATNYNGYNISCNGYSNGSIELFIAGGTPPYSYAWTTGQNTALITGLTAGTYSCTVTDADGCMISQTVAITEPTPFQTTIAASNISCNGYSDGGIDLSVSGSVPGYTYLWNTFATTEDITSLPMGTYSVDITDLNSCITSTSFTITEPTALLAVISSTNVSCNGLNDGTASALGAGGTGTYTYLWTGPNGFISTNPFLGGLAAGTYTLTLTDDNGCIYTTTLSLTINSSTISMTNITSCDSLVWNGTTYTQSGAYSYLTINSVGCDSTAILSLTIVNSTTSTDTQVACDTYTWLDGITYTASGIYTFITTNAAGCNNVATLNLTINNSTTSISNVTACDTYTWNGTTYSQIGVGVYTYSTTASTGCDSTATLNLTINPLPDAVISGSIAICEGEITPIAFTFPNGAPPYNVNWTINGTATNIILSNMVDFIMVNPNITTTYTLVDITDANGCSAALIGSITVTVHDLPLFSISSENIGCANQSNGSATAIITSASWPVSYAWSNGQTAQTANGLGVGTYTCIVTDVNGCANIQSISIDNPYLIDQRIMVGYLDDTLGINGSPSLGNNQKSVHIDTSGWHYVVMTKSDSTPSEGKIYVDGQLMFGGYFALYSYLYSELHIGAGFHTGWQQFFKGWIDELRVSDVVRTDTEILNHYTSNNPFIADNNTIGLWHFDESSGTTFSNDGLGGNSSGNLFGAVWDPVIAKFGNSVYFDGIDDYGNCNIDIPEYNITIEFWVNLDSLQFAASMVEAYGLYNTRIQTWYDTLYVDSMTNNILTTNESCNGAADGSIDFTVSGGAPPYTFLWSNGQITEDLENLPTGDYWITVTDSNLCGITDSVSIGLNDGDCFFIPTAFTPNGDAIHDDWEIDGIDLFPDISVKIFNRWGQLLFESVGYAQRWDGTYEGKKLPTAAYYYIITLNNGSEPYKGTITIKR